METLLRVLIVEDNEDDAMLLLRLLRRAGYDPVFALVQTAADLTAALGREDWDLVVSDYALPQFDAPTALRLLKQFGRDVPFIVVSGTVSEVTAVEMMKAGAHDYVLKHNLIRFVPAVQRELREAAGRRELAKSEQSRQGLEIERDRLLEQLKQENEDLAALTLVSSSAISTLDLGDLLRDLLTRIADLMHADTASISLADGAELRVYASAGVVGVTSRDDARVIRIGEGFIGAVALQAQPVYVEDAALDPRIQEPRFLEPGIRSALGVPLTRNGTLIGVLSVGWRSARARRDREVHLLEITAERCAAAIQNSQKYEESRRLTIALTESEARFRTIVESDLIGLMYWNANGEITGANDALLRIIGYTQDDVRAGRVQWRNMTPPEYRAQDEAVLEELATKGSSAPFEKEYIHRDGSRVWILIGAALYTSSPGHGVAFVIDISQRKRAEQAQRWSEQRYRAIFAAEPECVKVLDADGHLLEMNAAGLAMLEADSLSDVRSSGLASFVLPEYREAFRVLHARALTGYSGLLEFEIVGRHGTRRWLETHAAPLLDATGNVSMMLGITRDVTGRKLATEELRRSEQDLAITLQSIGDGVIATDTAGLVTRMNATAERLTGWSLAEAVGKSLPEVFNIIHAKTREPVRDPAQAVLSREEVVHLASQTALIARDGSEYRIADSAAPIRDAAGDIAGVVLVFNDVSEKVLAQQTLAETVSLLERTGEMAKIGGWELDVRTMSLHWSKEAFRIHDVDDLSIHDFEGGMKFYPPEAQPIMRAAVQAAIDHGTPYDLELPKITATGRHIFVRTQATVVMEDGKAIKLLGAVHDITARKQADAELRLQGAAMNAAADAIVITNRDGTIEWVNPAFTALTGYSAKEAVGRRHKELVSSGVHDRAFFQDLWNTILADRVWHGEMTNRRKDLSRYIVDQAITPVKDEFGEFSNFIAIERDLTEHRRLEGQFLQAQKMEVVGRLASGIAHDFNNLLTVINGTADLALTQLDQDDPLREDFAQIHSAGDRAASLTRQLLAFSRQQVMQPVILNLSALVVNLHDLLQRLIGEDIALVVTENTQPGMVRADPVQIEQVILNLAVNARDAMPNAGVMTIEVQNVDLDGLAVVGSASVPSGPYVLLAVSDTGKGMDDVTRSRIFEPFFTTKELGKGTGLGLSTVYGIVSQTGGHIVVDSKLGRGSSFLIYLPRVDSSTHPAVRRTPAMTPQVAATETILIVEDEEVVRHLAVRMLQLAGYTVLSAGNGPEALALIERQVLPVHMVFTDAVMPLMTGGELATHIEALYPNTKVLFTSGYTDDEKIHGTMPGPSTHFIGKPYSGSDLRRKVREVLDLGPTTVVSV